MRIFREVFPNKFCVSVRYGKKEKYNFLLAAWNCRFMRKYYNLTKKIESKLWVLIMNETYL